MKNYNTSFLGDCCDNNVGLPEKCLTEREIIDLLAVKADKVNTLDKAFFISQLNIIEARLSSIEARLAALE
jgi:hypothetical protein